MLSAATGSALTFAVLQKTSSKTSQVVAAKDDTSAGVMKIMRNNTDYKFISPILSVEPEKESECYNAIKKELSDYIEQEKQKGVTSVSVHFKDLKTSNWFSLNSLERYDPGSLLKVGVLITYMRMADIDKNLLNMEVTYHGQKGFVFPVEHFGSDTVIEGHRYTINQLIQSMIRNSDNRATLFLEDHMDTTIFKREFDDLGITEPHFTGPKFTLNVQEYSMMFKALYGAGYLRKAASENALAMLAQSVFKDGLRKGIPSSVVMAHKYGESGNGITHELHEAGIIYLDNKPYLLTVMSRGTDWNELSDVIGHISKTIYEYRVAN